MWTIGLARLLIDVSNLLELVTAPAQLVLNLTLVTAQ